METSDFEVVERTVIHGSFQSVLEQIVNVIIHHSHLKQRKIFFQNDNGKITINGLVKSWYEKQLAQEAVRNIEGVVLIDNQLSVEQ